MRDFLYPPLRGRLEALGWKEWTDNEGEGSRRHTPISWLLTQLESARAHKPAIERIDTVRRALREAAIVSRGECRDMKAVDVADQTLNRLIEGEFDE